MPSNHVDSDCRMSLSSSSSSATSTQSKNDLVNGSTPKCPVVPVTVKMKKTSPSDDGSETSLFQRTPSAHSLPLQVTNGPSLYEKTLHSLANDIHFQKEVALGKRIGFYRLGKELGCGNFSKVRLGVHVLTKEKVAVKIMEKSKMDQKAQRLLAREINSMEQTHHPNIIRLFECVETLSKTYLIMEYAGGGELYTYIHENGKLTETVAKSLLAQVISAVGHLHSKGIVHRDIKAENVIFAHQGWVKLADFGFSCVCKENAMLQTFCGSPPSAAPELFKDQNYNGQAVDCWAIGVLMYFMLVGITPFKGENVQELKKCILEGRYIIPGYISDYGQNLIKRMLEVDVSKRATIAELKKMLWLKDTKFTDSYMQFSVTPNEKELESNPLEQSVWTKLNEYGITIDMIKEAMGKGARNAVVGTYRIVLYQHQANDLDNERVKVNGHLIEMAERNKLAQQRLNSQSKACSIM
ncbi:hypothetical protein M3Y97_00569000 [Aphelenchoides bicaudatus]|nr:hypothetical protein M3Y97_00569000 [Aphelenchoides bicaudatus]